MAKPSAQSHAADPSPAEAPEPVNPDFVELVAEDGDHVEPPPPEVVEPDPELTPEEAEQARKDYLLTRFWISARGFWGKSGDRLAWLFSIGLLILIVANVGFQYGINVWNRAIFDAIEKRDSATVFYPHRGVLSAGDRQRPARRRPGVRAHGHPAPLARLADQFGGVALADQRPLLPAQPRQRRSPEPGIPHRRGSAHRDRLAGRFHGRRHLGVPLGRDLHRRALDHRRRADASRSRAPPSPFPASS